MLEAGNGGCKWVYGDKIIRTNSVEWKISMPVDQCVCIESKTGSWFILIN